MASVLFGFGLGSADPDSSSVKNFKLKTELVKDVTHEAKPVKALKKSACLVVYSQAGPGLRRAAETLVWA
jgi:hypothetical protein